MGRRSLSTGLALPRSTKRFLESRADVQTRQTVLHFHRWMEDHSLTVSSLEALHVRDFLKLNPHPRHRRGLWKYFEWLHDRGHLPFDPSFLTNYRKQLPALAVEYLEHLAVTLKPSSCNSTRTDLRRFHHHLRIEGVPVLRLKRDHVVRWLNSMRERGLHPATRRAGIIHARAYLRWLKERGALHGDPEDLLRRSDLPKLPEYLPRPLPPKVDVELRRRWSKSNGIYQLGLSLMRRTGLRIGELINLSYGCIRTDERRHHYLKVPLGKLDNERLVPIDDATRALIEKIRRRPPRRRAWLLWTPQGTKTRYETYRETLKRTAAGLEIEDRLTCHRLRHTYATELMNAGMSMAAVMKILGHRDYRMTLRYAAITEQTVHREYHEALRQLEPRYVDYERKDVDRSEPDPIKMLADITRALSKNSRLPPKIRRRIERLIRDVKPLIDQR
jgi:site-specific recombinase XerD